MGLTTDDVQAVLAQWDEWVTDHTFDLKIEVRDQAGGPVTDVVCDGRPSLVAHFNAQYYCQVTVRRGDVIVFSDRIPHSAEALRASVTVLARTIASYQPPED